MRVCLLHITNILFSEFLYSFTLMRISSLQSSYGWWVLGSSCLHCILRYYIHFSDLDGYDILEISNLRGLSCRFGWLFLLVFLLFSVTLSAFCHVCYSWNNISARDILFQVRYIVLDSYFTSLCPTLSDSVSAQISKVVPMLLNKK